PSGRRPLARPGPLLRLANREPERGGVRLPARLLGFPDRREQALDAGLGSPSRGAILSEVYESRPSFRSFRMSTSSAELLRQIKSKIKEVDPSEVKELTHEGVTIVDVRGSEEFATGHLPGAKSVPRGHLESRIEGVVPDRSSHVILYCASGQRSAYAARTMIEDLGYENVNSMTGGIALWKDRG